METQTEQKEFYFCIDQLIQKWRRGYFAITANTIEEARKIAVENFKNDIDSLYDKTNGNWINMGDVSILTEELYDGQELTNLDVCPLVVIDYSDDTIRDFTSKEEQELADKINNNLSARFNEIKNSFTPP